MADQLIKLSDYIVDAYSLLPLLQNYINPWDITANSEEIVKQIIQTLGDEYEIKDNVAMHKTAIIENNITFKGVAIIGKNTRVAANAYFREGVFLADDVTIGPSSEIKASFIFSHSAVAHLNYVGNSLIGSHVNIEGGAILAVHYNERENKEVSVNVDGQIVKTDVEKFGSVVGDNAKIGANAVLSPGTILKPGTIVDRLQLI